MPRHGSRNRKGKVLVGVMARQGYGAITLIRGNFAITIPQSGLYSTGLIKEEIREAINNMSTVEDIVNIHEKYEIDVEVI